MSEYTFLVLNLALAFYNTGTIWAHEIDIFRSWKLVGPPEFHRVQEVLWHKLPYWVLTPFGLALIGVIRAARLPPARVAGVGDLDKRCGSDSRPGSHWTLLGALASAPQSRFCRSAESIPRDDPPHALGADTAHQHRRIGAASIRGRSALVPN